VRSEQNGAAAVGRAERGSRERDRQFGSVIEMGVAMVVCGAICGRRVFGSH
jgi:hypothetical protein